MKTTITPVEKAEIKEFYDGTLASIRYLAKALKRSETFIKWHANFKGYRKKQRQACLDWQRNNPDKVKAHNQKYYQKNAEKIKRQTADYQKKRYHRDEGFRQKMIAKSKAQYRRKKQLQIK